MNGNYLIKKEKFIQVLKNWVNNTIAKELWKNYDDIHIDDIDEYFKEKSTWLEGSIFLLNCINDFIDKAKYDVFLVITLGCVSKPETINTVSMDWINSNLDNIPPSFYLFPKNNSIYEDTLKSAKFFEEFSNSIGFQFFYKEEKDEKEYSRVIYLRSF